MGGRMLLKLCTLVPKKGSRIMLRCAHNMTSHSQWRRTNQVCSSMLNDALLLQTVFATATPLTVLPGPELCMLTATAGEEELEATATLPPDVVPLTAGGVVTT